MKLDALYKRMANSIPQLKGNRVWCRNCRKAIHVDSAKALNAGWPKCCGYTMTIDHPDTWDK